jgi:hypothetical protein
MTSVKKIMNRRARLQAFTASIVVTGLAVTGGAAIAHRSIELGIKSVAKSPILYFLNHSTLPINPRNGRSGSRSGMARRIRRKHVYRYVNGGDTRRNPRLRWG